MEDRKQLRTELLKAVNEDPARDLMYDLVQTYAKYMEIHHMFLSDEGLTSTDAHTLKHICQNPGVTMSDMVKYWGKTKGTISAQVSALEEKGLVKKEKCKVNAKKTHIFPTEKGLQMNDCHTEFDIDEIIRFRSLWEEKYTVEEFYKFWEMLAFYKDFLEQRIKQQ